MHVRGDRDAEPCAGLHVDVRVDAALADQPQVGQTLEQRRADLGALPDQDESIEALQSLGEGIGLVEFFRLFRPEEGRLGVTVTFAAILELLREQLVEIAQAEPYQPLYVRRIDPDPETAVIDDVQITTA